MFFWILILLLSIAAFLALIIFVFPNRYFKDKYLVEKSCDRGIKKYKSDNDGEYAVVYEPQLSIRKYIKQYAISEREGKKFLDCLIDEDVFFLELEVFLFDAYNQVFDVINVKDLIKTKGSTHTLSLPEATAYVSIMINRVNDKTLNKKTSAKISFGTMLSFWTVSMLSFIAVTLVIRCSLINMFAGMFKQSMILSLEGNLQSALVAIVLNVIYLTVLTVILKNKKK